jgi:hypothetical protein
MERAGKKVQFTYEANPGEVWEEAEFWVELSAAWIPTASSGCASGSRAPYREGELITRTSTGVDLRKQRPRACPRRRRRRA